MGAAAIVVSSQATIARYGIPPVFLFLPQEADRVGTETEHPGQVNGGIISLFVCCLWTLIVPYYGIYEPTLWVRLSKGNKFT